MLKKSILLENKASISTKNLQLVIKTEIRESSIPIEDIGFIVIDHPEIYLSIPAMNLLVENNTSVIICNTSHYSIPSTTSWIVFRLIILYLFYLKSM